MDVILCSYGKKISAFIIFAEVIYNTLLIQGFTEIGFPNVIKCNLRVCDKIYKKIKVIKLNKLKIQKPASSIWNNINVL